MVWRESQPRGPEAMGPPGGMYHSPVFPAEFTGFQMLASSGLFFWNITLAIAVETARRTHMKQKELSPAAPGDERTPDKTIGEVKYAEKKTGKEQGGAGKPQTSKMEPEKQGGVGGP
jgi:hypothetical protein